MVVAGWGEPAARRRAVAGPAERPALPYDFRRPDRFAPQAVRNLEVAHEIFTRRVGNAWGAALRGVVTLDLVAVDQVSYDDYVRSLPTPALLATVALPPLPGAVIVDLNIELALQLLDRLLGATGGGSGPVAARRPTDLESAVLADLVRRTLPGLEETLGAFAEVDSELLGVEYNPQLVQAAAPSDGMLLLTFAVRATQGFSADGLLTLCYPSAVAVPLVDRITALLRTDEPADAVDEDWRAALRQGLEEVAVDLRINLEDTAVPAVDLASLQVGDVLRLDHRVDRPVRGVVEGRQVLTGHLGCRGRRLGVQVLHPPTGFPASNRSTA